MDFSNITSFLFDGVITTLFLIALGIFLHPYVPLLIVILVILKDVFGFWGGHFSLSTMYFITVALIVFCLFYLAAKIPSSGDSQQRLKHSSNDNSESDENAEIGIFTFKAIAEVAEKCEKIRRLNDKYLELQRYSSSLDTDEYVQLSDELDREIGNLQSDLHDLISYIEGNGVTVYGYYRGYTGGIISFYDNDGILLRQVS